MIDDLVETVLNKKAGMGFARPSVHDLAPSDLAMANALVSSFLIISFLLVAGSSTAGFVAFFRNLHGKQRQ